MKNCQTMEPLLGAYLDQELDVEPRKKVSLHLKECPSCCEELEGLKKFIALSHSCAVPSVSPETWELNFQQLRQNINFFQKRKTTRPVFWTVMTMSGVAAAILLYMFLLFSGKSIPNTSTSNPSIAQTKPVKAPVDQVSNESHVEYLETGEEYTSSIEIPATKNEMCVITIEKQK